MFKAHDGKGCTPFDLGYKVGEMGGDEHNPYDEDTEACAEFSDGYSAASMNWNEDEESDF